MIQRSCSSSSGICSGICRRRNADWPAGATLAENVPQLATAADGREAAQEGRTGTVRNDRATVWNLHGPLPEFRIQTVAAPKP